MNGDGIPDFLVGAPQYDPFENDPPLTVAPGYVRLHSGDPNPPSSPPFFLLGEISGPGDKEQSFGFSVTGMYADMDIDGTLDVAVGAPGTNHPNLGDDWGAAYVLSGAAVMGMAPDPFPALETFDGEDKGSFFGASVAGDPGFPEEAICPKLAVAAPRFSLGDVETPCDCGDEGRQNLNGKVYVYLGKTPLLTASYVGERNRDRLGKGLAWIGNAGDTEVNDLMLSGFAWACESSPSEAGRTYITLY